jgi:hypothetical protein
MKIITKKYEVYKFEELNKKAQDKAISDEIRFMVETISYEEANTNLKKAYDKAEEMMTPWFTESYIYDYCKDEIIETIKINEYAFLKDGSLFNE